MSASAAQSNGLGLHIDGVSVARGSRTVVRDVSNRSASHARCGLAMSLIRSKPVAPRL